MKHIEYYESDDGKIFDNEYDCAKYEMSKILDNTNSLIMIDFDGVRIEKVDSDSMKSVEIIIIKDELASSIVEEIGDYYGFEFPCQIGSYWWDNDKWMSYNQIENNYYYYKNIKEELESYCK